MQAVKLFAKSACAAKWPAPIVRPVTADHQRYRNTDMTIRIKDLIADARAQGCPARYELLGYSLVVSIVNGRPLVMQNGTRISQKDAQQFIDATYERRQRGYRLISLRSSQSEASLAAAKRLLTTQSIASTGSSLKGSSIPWTMNRQPVTSSSAALRRQHSASVTLAKTMR